MDRYVYPNEDRFYKDAEELSPWKLYPVVEELTPRRRVLEVVSACEQAWRRSRQS